MVLIYFGIWTQFLIHAFLILSPSFGFQIMEIVLCNILLTFLHMHKLFKDFSPWRSDLQNECDKLLLEWGFKYLTHMHKLHKSFKSEENERSWNHVLFLSSSSSFPRFWKGLISRPTFSMHKCAHYSTPLRRGTKYNFAHVKGCCKRVKYWQ